MFTTNRQNALTDCWGKTLAREASRTAIYHLDGTVARTFQAIEEEAMDWQRRLSGYSSGSVVALRIGNVPSWPALVIALMRNGLVPLPVGGHVSDHEFTLIAKRCRVAGVITLRGGELHLDRLAAESPQEDLAAEFLKLTSGTTGMPRAIRFTARQLVADAENICSTMGIRPDDLNFGAVPMSHSYGFSNLVTPLICQGTALVATDERFPRAVLNGLLATKATVFPGNPVLFDKLREVAGEVALPHLRLCISAGAPLTKAVAEPFTARFGLKIHTFYGSSECGGIGYDRSEEARYEDGFAGTPMDGVSIEGDSTEDPQEGGGLTIRSHAVGEGYWPEPDPDVLGGGRFVPGDLVRWDGDRMYIVGRTGDIINVAGRKLNPLEVERAIAGFEGVRQAVVFGVPSSLRGEEPVVCIVGEGVDSQAILRTCRERLSEWQVPKDVWFVSEIPVNDRGKISRRALARAYLDAQQG